MIELLPPGPESEAKIKKLANSYAQKVIDSVDWLRNLSPTESIDAQLMIFAHADEDLLNEAFDNICVYGDEVEDLQAEGK